jgi:hypothetical protein
MALDVFEDCLKLDTHWHPFGCHKARTTIAQQGSEPYDPVSSMRREPDAEWPAFSMIMQTCDDTKLVVGISPKHLQPQSVLRPEVIALFVGLTSLRDTP